MVPACCTAMTPLAMSSLTCASAARLTLTRSQGETGPYCLWMQPTVIAVRRTTKLVRCRIFPPHLLKFRLRRHFDITNSSPELTRSGTALLIGHYFFEVEGWPVFAQIEAFRHSSVIKRVLSM